MVVLFFTKLKILLKSVVVGELILKRFVMPDLCRNAMSRLTDKLTATMRIYQTLLKLPVAVLSSKPHQSPKSIALCMLLSTI